ncbi:MAG: hypothetical protein AAF799_06260 [Myxococcota bacterium]
MARRSKSKRIEGERTRRGKKPSGREKKPKVYARPYHVDLARSLAELEGWTPTQPSDGGGGLIGRHQTATSKPIGQLDVRELEMLITQGSELHWLWPVILETLRADIGASFGTGLLRLVIGRRSFWVSHPHARTELVRLIGERTEALQGDLDDGLFDAATSFVEQG